jgi:hypothetical protein
MSDSMFVEVFKTNVNDKYQASMLIDEIRNYFEDYEANFDLDDCDRILRVRSATRYVEPKQLINMLKLHGVEAQVLPDDDELAGEALLDDLNNYLEKN